MARRVKFIIFFLFLLLVVSPLSSEAGLGPPHNIAKCSDCHAGGFAEGLFSVTPNCLNCHGSGKLAASRPFAENDASRLLNYSSSGTGQNISHAWGVTVNEPRAGSSYPSDILGTYVSKVTRSVQKVSCPSCHAVHYRVYPKMLRGPYESLDYTAYGIGILYGVNQLCLECHSARNQTHHTGHSHPVRVQLPDDQARFNYPPYLDPAFAHVSSSILKLYSTPGGPDTVMCLTCHGIHMTDSNPYTFDRFTTYSSAMENLSTGDGFLLRQYNDSTLCRNCHDYQFHNAMVCRNCHDPHSVGDNYYLIMNNISTPTIGGNSYGNISVSLTNLSSGFVLFNDTGPRGVCETCHRLSTDSPSGALFQGWSSAHAALGINKSDAPNYNCLECHNHKVGTGTKSFAGCNGCHGTPPNSNVAGGPDGYASFAGNSYLNDGPFLDESQTPHRKHAIDYPFGNQGAGYGTAGQCRACHSNDKSLHMNTVYQNVNFGLHSTTGDGRNYNTGTRQCSNVYCHSNSGPWDGASYTAPTYRPPTWGAPGTLPGAWQCEGCHDWPPPTNKHPTHADGDYATKPYSFDCANCHDATVDNYSTIADTSYHVNKEKNVIFGHIAKTGGANPFYNATTHRCSNVYCHGNFPYGNNTTVQWDSESPCGSCHDVPNTATSHDRHVTDYNFDCANCHEATMDVSSSDISGYDVHVDGEKTVEFGIARDGVIDNRDGISTTGPRKCDNIYCHSRGTDFDAPFDTITSEPNSQATWAAAISCNYCHGNTVYSDWRKAMPNYTTGNPKGNSHQTHVINNGVECYTCHSVTLANSSTIGSTVTHVNKEYNIDLVAKYDVGDPNYNAGTHTCDNASCHGGNITPAWGNTIECENCHGNDHDVDNYAQWTNFTGVVAQIYTSDFKVRGHGRTSGNYDITENVGANRVCKDCHDQTAPHGGADKPFRTKWSGDLDTFCLSCHGSGDDLQGAFSSMTGIKTHSFAGMSEANGYQNHTSWRITPKCIDCHDPHGDGNIAMIHDKVHSGGSDEKGRRNAFFNKSTVVFLNHSNDNSFANSSDTSICQACHTKTDHFRQEGFGGAADQLHTNIGGVVGKRCTPLCHNHKGGFAHGVSDGGSGGGSGCVKCHGHEEGTEIDTDATYPWASGSGEYSIGAGTTTPHSTHTESYIPGAAGDDDRRGPGIYCSTCHDIDNIPTFNSGTDGNGDGVINLDETDVCNTCHSPNGTYDGVNDPVIGAKNNWHSGGVYDNNTTLKAGKEKWCAGCHDEDAALISSVTAPNVIGDEDGDHAYGIGWGFYKTGHGLDAGNFPASEAPASARECHNCHNTTLSHIDGEHRTYSAAGDNYQTGYRLKYNMDIPRTDTGEPVSDFALCLSCHDSSKFLVQNNYTTNFRQDTTTNDHWRHLQGPTTGPWATGNRWDSDWDGTADSKISCPACHNVHGSPSPKMLRHGELISTPGTTDKVPALNFKYLPLTSPVLMDSIGGKLSPTSPGGGTVANTGVCNMCHSNQESYTRTPRDIYPPSIEGVYGAVGSNKLFVGFSKGVYTNTGGSGSLLLSDFTFTDIDDGRTMSVMSHTAGADYSWITLSSVLDGTNDIDTDTLAAATSTSVYDIYDNAMGTEGVIVISDTTAPSTANLVPANGASGISVDKSLSITLVDSDSGVDFTTFSITLTGNKGYSKSYSDLDTSIVTKTGGREYYAVTIDPDSNFTYNELITVTVSVDDYMGNSLVSPTWSFTSSTGATFETVRIHPSGINNAYSFTNVGGDWADVLDGNDQLDSYVNRCGGSGYPGDTTSRFVVDMDNWSLGAVNMQSIDVGMAAKYAPSCPTDGTASGTAGICYNTGSTNVCADSALSGDFATYFLTYSTDSDGGYLDTTDINNMIVEIQRKSSGSIHLIASEVYVDVTYIPIPADSVAPSSSNLSPVNGATEVAVNQDLTLDLSDTLSGVDYTTFSITLSGDKGYSQTYTDLDTGVVSKTGDMSSYSVTINPDVPFSSGEVITVTVNVDDYASNSLTPPTWSFAAVAAAGPITATLHPSGIAQYDTAANIDDGGTFTLNSGTWATALDSNDGETSRTNKCCDGGPNNAWTEWMAVNIDNLSALTGGQAPGANPTINSLKFYVVARYRATGGSSEANVAHTFKVGYTTNDTTPPANTVPTIDAEHTTSSSGSDFQLFTSQTYTTGLTLSSIDNLLIWVRYDKTVNRTLRVTEIYAEVEYIPGD